MDCRHTILIRNKVLYIKINTRADYNFKSQISLRQWLQLWRYEIGFMRNADGQGYRWWLNKKEG
jgi:hypothetical protein